MSAAGFENAREFPQGTRTAADAAAAIGCEVGAICKSLVFRVGDEPLLIIASGANRVDEARFGAEKADAAFVREQTGFAIGGVPPYGHARRDRDDRRRGPARLPDGVGGGGHAVVGLPDRAGRARGAHRRRASSASVQEADHVARGRALGRALLLARRAEVQQADDVLVVVDAQRGAALGGAQDGRRAPVARQPAAVRAEQDDVGGAGRGAAGPPRRPPGRRCARAETATSVGARSSLAAASAPAASLSRASAAGPRTRKRHGLVRWWLGAQRAEVEQLGERLAVDGLAAVGLVRPPGADGLLELHLVVLVVLVVVLGVERLVRELAAAAVEDA